MVKEQEFWIKDQESHYEQLEEERRLPLLLTLALRKRQTCEEELYYSNHHLVFMKF
mgnify:FL=1